VAGIEPKRACAALHNLLERRQEYGRVSWVASEFEISRPTLYRMEAKFLRTFSVGPGRPRKSSKDADNQNLRNRLENLEHENEQLRMELDQARQATRLSAERSKFFLIASGMGARTITRLRRECFGVRANRTDILQERAEYARRATEIMQQYFWPAARDVDLDEIFIENLPLFLAVEPRSLAITKASKEEDRTEEKWSAFLNDMPNLERTTSDRGTAIMAAIRKRDDLTHQSDIFHPKRLLHTELRKKRRGCYKLIAKEYEAQEQLLKAKAKGKDCRSPALRYRHALRKAQNAMELFEELEQAVQVAFEALRLTTANGKLNTASNAQQSLELARFWIHEHLPKGWSKVKSALEDEALLTFLRELEARLDGIRVDTRTPEEREYVLATLAKLWEDQAKKRQRGRPVHVPEQVQQELSMRCSNLEAVKAHLFDVLDRLHRASSAIECINSRVGLYRYSLRRFSTDYANLIALWHNLTPFEEGKRAGKCPAEILGVNLPTYDIYELLGIQ